MKSFRFFYVIFYLLEITKKKYNKNICYKNKVYDTETSVSIIYKNIQNALSQIIKIVFKVIIKTKI